MDCRGSRSCMGAQVATTRRQGRRCEVNEAQGTFACPICGYDEPHAHSEAEQQAYRDDQIRNDGWRSALIKRPTESGWHLCIGVEVAHIKDDSQRHWFLWVRDFMMGVSGCWKQEQVPEVLYYSKSDDAWMLRNALGNATSSGKEMRRPVEARVKLWREIPSIGKSTSPTKDHP